MNEQKKESAGPSGKGHGAKIKAVSFSNDDTPNRRGLATRFFWCRASNSVETFDRGALT